MAAPKQMRPLLHTALPHCLIYLSRVWSTRVPNVDLLSWARNCKTHHPRYLLSSFFVFIEDSLKYWSKDAPCDVLIVLCNFTSAIQRDLLRSSAFSLSFQSVFHLQKKRVKQTDVFYWMSHCERERFYKSRRWMMQTRTLSNFTFCVHGVITLRYTQISSYLHLRIKEDILLFISYCILLTGR